MSLKGSGLGRRLRAAARRWSAFQIALFSLLVGCALGVIATSLLSTSPGEAAAQRAVPKLPLPSAGVVRQVLQGEVTAPCQPRNARRLSCLVSQGVTLRVGERLRVATSGPEDATVRVVSVEAADPITGQRQVVVKAESFNGASASELIISRSPAGSVLSVPVGAIWRAPGGGFEVRKLVGSGVRPVLVKIGATAGGYVAISARGISTAERVELTSESGSELVGQPLPPGTP